MPTLEAKLHSTYMLLLHKTAELLSYRTAGNVVVLPVGQSAEIPLNWGAEGQEGPVLATGGPILRHHLIVMHPHTCYTLPV